MERCISGVWRCLLTCLLATLHAQYSLYESEPEPFYLPESYDHGGWGKEGTLYFGPHGRGKCGFDLGANGRESMLGTAENS